LRRQAGHAQAFAVECRIPSLDIVASGSGTSRRGAEQDAAARAYALVTAPGGER
jgi:ribonuclease-3